MKKSQILCSLLGEIATVGYCLLPRLVGCRNDGLTYPSNAQLLTQLFKNRPKHPNTQHSTF